MSHQLPAAISLLSGFMGDSWILKSAFVFDLPQCHASSSLRY
jgi:hypothetical protein